MGETQDEPGAPHDIPKCKEVLKKNDIMLKGNRSQLKRVLDGQNWKLLSNKINNGTTEL